MTTATLNGNDRSTAMLRTFVDKHNLSRNDAAFLLGLSLSQLEDYLEGRKLPHRDLLTRMETATPILEGKGPKITYKGLMDRFNLNQKDLAQIAGVVPSTFSIAIRGAVRKPGITPEDLLAKILFMSEKELNKIRKTKTLKEPKPLAARIEEVYEYCSEHNIRPSEMSIGLGFCSNYLSALKHRGGDVSDKTWEQFKALRDKEITKTVAFVQAESVNGTPNGKPAIVGGFTPRQALSRRWSGWLAGSAVGAALISVGIALGSLL